MWDNEKDNCSAKVAT